MEFKNGDNGPYAKCEVALCDFWSGDPQEIKNHVIDVHNSPEERAEELVEEFEDFRTDNSENGEEEGKETIEKPSLVLEDRLAEQVYNGDFNKFAVWNGGDIEYKDEIDLGDKTLRPRADEPLKEGAILLPAKAENYEDTNTLLNEIKEFIHKWVDISDDFREMAAWYVLLTWVHDRVSTVPYLRFHGDLGTRKTQAIKTIGGLCYKAIDSAGSSSAAATERLVTHWGGTMMMNEADFYKSDARADIVKLLNEGFESGGLVMKAHKENQDKVVATRAYGPKILATRHRWDDQALESRCLTEEMRETKRDDILPVRTKDFREKQQELRNKLLMFRFENYHKINEEDIEKIWPKIREMDLERRLVQATISFSVLFWQDEEMFERFMDFLKKHQQGLIEERAATFDGGIVRAIYELRNEDYITSSDIAEHLENQQNYEDVRASTVGKHLRNLGLETKPKTIDGETKKPLSSSEKQIRNVFKRYLPDYDGEQLKITAITDITGYRTTKSGSSKSNTPVRGGGADGALMARNNRNTRNSETGEVEDHNTDTTDTKDRVNRVETSVPNETEVEELGRTQQDKIKALKEIKSELETEENLSKDTLIKEAEASGISSEFVYLCLKNGEIIA